MRQAVMLAPAGVFLAAFLIYVPSFDAYFAVLDFNHLDAIRSTEAATFFLRILDPSDGGRTVIGTGDLYRPTYYTVFWFEYQAFGTDPLPYYLFNATLHGVNTVLVFVLARRLTQSMLASVAAGVVWALHPQYVDAVAWVSSTTDLLLVFFGLGAILLYGVALEERGVRRGFFLAASLVSAVFALGAKESGIVVVLMIAGYHVLIGEPDLLRRRRVPWELAPFLAVPLVYFPLRAALVGNLASEGGNEIFSWNVFANMHTLASYAAGPIVGEIVATHEFGIAQGAAGVGLIAAIAIGALAGSRREWFLAGWFFVAMGPVLIFPEVWLVGRYLYLGFVGPAIMAGIAFDRLVAGIPARLPGIAGLQVGSAAMLLAGAALWLGWFNVDHQELQTAKGEEAGAFLAELRETYPEPPRAGRLIVRQHPRSLSFAENDGMMLAPAVRIAYDENVEVITQWHLNRGEHPPTEDDLWYPP